MLIRNCHAQASRAFFLELLRVRYSTLLLRLPQADHIKRQLTFHNTGPEQVTAACPYAVCVSCAVRPACSFDKSVLNITVCHLECHRCQG